MPAPRPLTQLQVRDNINLLMNTTRSSARPPPWFAALTDYPPSAALARPPAIQHQDPHAHLLASPPQTTYTASPQRRLPRKQKKYRKPSKMFMPQQMQYDEDKLRQQFFKDHPWELARPRILVEDKEARARWDWSKEWEEGRPCDGESVIQRQHALIQSGLTTPAAYDKSRKEFYSRQAFNQTEVRVAAEEARAVGAQFSDEISPLNWGMKLENRAFEKWRVWANEQVTLQEQARQANYAAMGEDADRGAGGPDLADVVNMLEDAAQGPEGEKQGGEQGGEGDKGVDDVEGGERQRETVEVPTMGGGRRTRG